MRIITDPQKIKRNSKIGLYTSLASLVLLVAAVILTFNSDPRMVSYSFFAMIAGLILSQIGVYFANRWGKSPRIDERITQSLKGLDDRYTLYHYTTPVPHLLTGPAGIWVIVPQYQAGTITYDNNRNRYRQKGVGFFARFVGQESLGRPDLEAKAYQEEFEKFLKKSLEDGSVPQINTIIVFTNPKAIVQVQNSPIPTLHVEKLKDFVRRKSKEQAVSMDLIRQVGELLPEEDVS